MIRPTPALVLACYAAAFGAPAPVPDLDRDGIVGHGDLAAVTAAFFVSADGDLTGDGATDDDDLAVVLAAWGQRFIYTAPPHVYGAEPTITIPLACLVRVTDRGWFVRLDAADGSVAEAHGSAEWWALRLDAWGWRGEYVLSAQTMHALGLPTTPYGPEITTFVLDTGAGVAP